MSWRIHLAPAARFAAAGAEGAGAVVHRGRADEGGSRAVARARAAWRRGGDGVRGGAEAAARQEVEGRMTCVLPLLMRAGLGSGDR